jgi:hypothetical protein
MFSMMKKGSICCTRKQDESDKKKLVISNLSWSFDEARKALSSSSFQNISNEIILHIFRFLSISDLSDHDDLWKSKCASKSNYLFFFVNSLL